MCTSITFTIDFKAGKAVSRHPGVGSDSQQEHAVCCFAALNDVTICLSCLDKGHKITLCIFDSVTDCQKGLVDCKISEHALKTSECNRRSLYEASHLLDVLWCTKSSFIQKLVCRADVITKSSCVGELFQAMRVNYLSKRYCAILLNIFRALMMTCSAFNLYVSKLNSLYVSYTK